MLGLETAQNLAGSVGHLFTGEAGTQAGQAVGHVMGPVVWGTKQVVRPAWELLKLLPVDEFQSSMVKTVEHVADLNRANAQTTVGIVEAGAAVGVLNLIQQAKQSWRNALLRAELAVTDFARDTGNVVENTLLGWFRTKPRTIR